MKKKLVSIVLCCTITLSVFFYFLGTANKNKFLQDADIKLDNLFKPIVNNTIFKVGEDTFLLQINNISIFNGYKSLKNGRSTPIRINYTVYKNDINEQNIVGNHYFSTFVWVRDKDKDKAYFLDELNKFNITNYELWHSFIELYCGKYYLDKINPEHLNWSGKGFYNTKDVKYDKYGLLMKPINVEYGMVLSVYDISVEFRSKFMLNPHGEKQLINIEVNKL